MAIKLKIIESRLIGKKEYESELASNFFTGKRFKVKVGGSWYYVVAYQDANKYEHIKHLLHGSKVEELFDKTIYYYKSFLDEKYIENMNKFADTCSKLMKNSEDAKKGRREIQKMALKELKIKEFKFENSIKIHDVQPWQ